MEEKEARITPIGSIDTLLPEELVIEILLRLPVKSLLDFKIVCKNWCNVIESRDFIDRHFDHRSNHARLLVYHSIPDSDLYEYGFTIFPDVTLAGQPPSHHFLDYLRTPSSLEYVIGPVRGLFLLCGPLMCGPYRHDNYRVALLNPATRECLPLFVPDSNQIPYFWSCLHCFGFGFDPLSSDFKIVAIWFLDDRRIGFHVGPPLVAVYSLANGCWKHLGPFISTVQSFICSHGSGSRYVNGSCYWLTDDNYKNNYSLVSFDMNHEVFREIEGPENPMSKDAHLVVQNDSIAVILYQDTGSIDLLVMRREGCWTKDLTFNTNLLQLRRPLGLWKNNNFFLEPSDRSIALYDPKTHQIKELGFYSDYIFSDYIFSYKESLVSLKFGSNYSLSKVLQDLFKVNTQNLEEAYLWCEGCMHDESRCTCGC